MTGLNMKSSLLALAALATVAFAVSPASAQYRYHTRSYDGGDFNTGQKVAIIGGGAAAGAVIGGLLGGKKGAIIGGAIGGGAGTIAVIAKEKSENHYYRGYRDGYGYGPYYQGYGPYYQGGRFSRGYYTGYRGPAWGDRWHDRDEHWRDGHRDGAWHRDDHVREVDAGRFNRMGRASRDGRR